MKKILITLAAVIILSFAIASVASANGGPHGGFTATTDACASCHRTHTATFGRLLMVDPATLCLSCHGTAGTGANTNVDDGLYVSGRNGGAYAVDGSTNTLNNDALLGGQFLGATSNHTLGSTDAWGQGATDRGTATALAGGATLQCVSCHDPHGSANYRIFKATVNLVPVAVAQVDETQATKDYSDENWGNDQSQLCRACHQAYHKTAVSQGNTLDGATYTHRVDMVWNDVPAGVTVGANNPETVGYDGTANNGDEVPLGSGGEVMCQTCHFPHGTTATVTALADDPNLPGATDSTLLRLDNRGVCQSCHQKP